MLMNCATGLNETTCYQHLDHCLAITDGHADCVLTSVESVERPAGIDQLVITAYYWADQLFTVMMFAFLIIAVGHAIHYAYVSVTRPHGFADVYWIERFGFAAGIMAVILLAIRV